MKSNKGITLIALVITIIVLIILAGISISILMGQDGVITKAKQGAQNYQNAAVEEQVMLNTLYTDFSSEVARTSESFVAQTRVSDGQAVTSAKMLKDYKAYVNGELITGTMENRGAVTETIAPGETYTIPEGYHDGTGTVTANGSGAAQVYYLGTGTSIDVKTKIPVGYDQLTADNFIVGVLNTSNFNNLVNKSDSTTVRSASCGYEGFNLSKSYDASTGILTIGGNTQKCWGRYSSSSNNMGSYSVCDVNSSSNVTPFVYAVVGTIN